MSFAFTDLSRDEDEKLEFGWKNLFLTLWREIYTLIRANLCFLIICLPVVTIPAALTALFGICIDAIQGQRCQVAKTYLKALKSQFFQSWGIFLGLAVTEAVSIVAAWFYFSRENWACGLLGLFATAIAVVGILMIPYCFCMMARVNLPFRETVKNAFLLSFLNVKFNICGAVLSAALLLILGLWWLYLIPLILLVGIAVPVYLSSYFTLYGLQKYILTEEL